MLMAGFLRSNTKRVYVFHHACHSTSALSSRISAKCFAKLYRSTTTKPGRFLRSRFPNGSHLAVLVTSNVRSTMGWDAVNDEGFAVDKLVVRESRVVASSSNNFLRFASWTAWAASFNLL